MGWRLFRRCIRTSAPPPASVPARAIPVAEAAMVEESRRESLANDESGEWFFRPKEPNGPAWRDPLDCIAGAFYWKVLLRLCLSWWLLKPIESTDAQPQAEKDTSDHRAVAAATAYLLATTAGIAALWLIYPSSDTWRIVFAALAAWRLLEIFAYGVGIAFGYKAPKLYDWIAVALYAFSVTLCYAILDHSLAGHDYKLSGGSSGASGSFDFLYIAWTQMTTLGNGYELTSNTSRGLAMAAATSGVLILGVLVASTLNQVFRERG